MVNDVIISGNYLGFNKNVLLLKIDDKIGIKVYLDIDKNQSIIIVATKLIIIKLKLYAILNAKKLN